MTRPARWIAVDWGTSNLRLWAMSDGDIVLQKIEDKRGMAALQRDEFSGVLQELVSRVPRTGEVLDVIACGMVGARQGWREAPYVSVPNVPPTGAEATQINLHNAGLRVFILPGMSQDSPADVMRGEETQVAGILADEPDLDGIICMPGTHCKWVRCSKGEITSFRTSMTGEVFGLLKRMSTLQHSVSSDAVDMHSFDRAVTQAFRDSASLLADLFAIRAGSLLHGTDKPSCTGQLSGLLIGADVRQARSFLGTSAVRLVAEGPLAELYERALGILNFEVQRLDAERITLAGLKVAQAKLLATTT